MGEHRSGLISREAVVAGERTPAHRVFYSDFPVNPESLAGKLVNNMAETLTRESSERQTLVPRQPEDLFTSGGIIFVFDSEGEMPLESDSPETVLSHLQGMAHLGLLYRDAVQPDRVTDVEIRGVKAVAKSGAGSEAILAAAELARERFPEAQLFIMVNDGSERTMEKLRSAGLVTYRAQDERDVPGAYFVDCQNCPVRPMGGCRRCCHTVLTIS